VVINTTQLADGTWRSLSNEEITRNQKLLGEIYQNELAYRLRQLGYEVEPKANGQFELKGYEPRSLDTFSTRTQQIEDYIQRWEQELEKTGGAPLSYKQKKQATLNTRKRKRIVPRDVPMRGWEEALRGQGLALPMIPQDVKDLSEQSQEQAAIATHLTLYTASQTELFRLARTSRAKQNASDYIPLFQVVNSHAQTPQNHSQTHSTTHPHRVIGECLGSRVSASLTSAKN
jgi:hypothetical protein